MSEVERNVMRGLLEVLVLESLSVSPKHGYALLKEMEALFGEEPNRNRIYPLLVKLEREGLIRSVAVEGEPRGRVRYEITPQGVERLNAYRSLPLPFRRAVLRIWGESLPLTPSPPPLEPSQKSESPPTTPPTLSDLPYPCPSAKITFERNLRTGWIGMALEGCPTGSYDYCPLCPVYSRLQNLSSILLGTTPPKPI